MGFIEQTPLCSKEFGQSPLLDNTIRNITYTHTHIHIISLAYMKSNEIIDKHLLTYDSLIDLFAS